MLFRSRICKIVKLLDIIIHTYTSSIVRLDSLDYNVKILLALLAVVEKKAIKGKDPEKISFQARKRYLGQV